MHLKTLLLAGVVAGLASAGAAHAKKAQPASATTTAPTAADVEALQNQITAMQAQVAYMKRQLELMNERNPPNAAPAPKVVQSSSNKFAIESADGQYSIALTGRLHLDTGDYINYDPKSSSTSPQNLNSGFNARRARIGVTGKAAGDFNYTFIYDAGGSSDASPSGIQQAQIGYTGIKNMSFEIGYSDTFFSLDEATGSNDTLFMERSVPGNVATNVNTGDFRSNVGGRWYNDRLWVGAYVTGPQNGNAHGQSESIGAFQRIAYQALADDNYTLHVGVGIDEIIKAPLNNGSTPSSTYTYDPTTGKITVGSAATTNSIVLSDRPELRIDPANLVSTGSLGTIGHPVSGGYIANFELAGNYGSFYAQGEYFHYSIDRDGLSTSNFDGGYGEVSYVLTGETRKYNPAIAAYKNPVPAHAFSPSEGYWGAWEVGGRISYIDLVDHFTPGIASSAQPNAVNGGKETTYTLGLNWYPNSYMRFMLNYVHADFSKSNSGTSGVLGAPAGANMDAIALRTQVAW